MRKLTPEQTGWTLMRIWMTAFEQAAADLDGIQAKHLCQKAYEYATEEWLRVLKEEYGITPAKAATIKEAVEAYIEVGIQGGLFKDAGQFVVKEYGPSSVEITVLDCPYAKTCMDLIAHGFSLKKITCSRIGCFQAAVRLLANIDCDYEVTSIKPDEGCQGIIERK
jgi:hypothetical protein